MTAVYNEFDPFAAQWLRNLIAAGHIAPGDVDERDLWDVAPDDWRGYEQVHVCAGIGVWSHALRNVGWPDARPIWTASLPCQPFSAAAKGLGFADERHLWPAFFHLVTHLRPDRIVGEQVASKDGLGWFDLVHADMEAADYACRAVDLCAAGVGAPHIRQRLWWVADRMEHASRNGREQWRSEPSGRDARAEGLQRSGEHRQFATDGDAGGVADAQSIGRDGRTHDHDGGRRERAPRQDGAAGGMGDTRHDGHAARPVRSPAYEGEVFSRVLQSERPSASFWSDVEWLGCRDHKWRPVEPGTFPLAHGIAGRVGRLRAYGNAIVAPVAEAFLRCLP